MQESQPPTAEQPRPRKLTIEFEDTTVRLFMLASIIWGAIGMLVGVIIALQMNFPALNFEREWFSFGRLRPLHTNAVIFALVGNMMFAGIYHSTQRLCKARTASLFLSRFHFWSWQAVILGAVITYPLGLTQSKEYAELIWPLDIVVVLSWVAFAVNFFWTLARRHEPSLYVAIWFYIATIVTIAMLYIVNNLQMPTSLVHSYPIFGGFQDALIQWWYGHNAVAFFLTTPILGIMYYYLPKAAERPVYSYRLSVIHFWSLVFLYIWAGPHHLLNTSLPNWLQAMGVIFSLMLWAPSWGGMLNGLLTLRGAWHKLRTDPVLKFFVAGLTFYGMATFEGPLLSIKSVNALAHYTDWIIAHVHSGAMGWNGFMAAGMFYWLAPRLWKTKLYSVGLANLHFWIGMVGILLYVAAMWVAGITQGLMLNATEGEGAVLKYPDFVETLNAIKPMMLARVVGGGLYLAGWVLMIYNLYRTIVGKAPQRQTMEVMVGATRSRAVSNWEGLVNWPLSYSALLIFFSCVWMLGGGLWMIVGMFGLITTTLSAIIHFRVSGARWADWYERLLENSMVFTLLIFIAVAIGGMVQIIPAITTITEKNTEGIEQRVLTPLEVAGRDIYVSEGCYNCHSQMVRVMVPDVVRYGDGVRYSKLGYSLYDRPFQWGSKRTGPDLAFVGGRRSDLWHYLHMEDPQSLAPGSNMPAYPWMMEKQVSFDTLPRRINVLRTLGVPYPEMSDAEVVEHARNQAQVIADRLYAEDILIEYDREIIAMIAYLQSLGVTDQPDFIRESTE